jgi:hypothetical protein
MLEDLLHGERFFTIRREKSLAVRELVQDTYQAEWSEAANPILFKF